LVFTHWQSNLDVQSGREMHQLVQNVNGYFVPGS